MSASQKSGDMSPQSKPRPRSAAQQLLQNPFRPLNADGDPALAGRRLYRERTCEPSPLKYFDTSISFFKQKNKNPKPCGFGFPNSDINNYYGRVWPVTVQVGLAFTVVAS